MASMLDIEIWPVDRPRDCPENARKWSKDAIAKVALSIQEYGFRQPIVVDAGEMICIGHLRRAAARHAGLAEVPVHVARDLTPLQIRGLRLADNRVHEESVWDYRLLATEFQGLLSLGMDLHLTGFNPAESAALLPTAEKQSEESQNTLRQKWRTKAGQRWKIGRHSLAIQNAEDAEEAKADLICTDPPYELPVAGLDRIMRRHGQIAIVLASDRLAFGFARLWDFRLDFIWRHRKARKIPSKNLPILFHAHCAVFCTEPGIKTGWQKPRRDFPSVIEIENEYEDKEGCGYGKSAELFERMLSGFASARIVCDPFAGSLVTILASERLDKTCIAFEVDPGIAAVGLERCQRAGLVPVELK